MTEKEKKEALARLSARDTASMKQMEIESTASDDKINAFSRIIEHLSVPILQAKHVYTQLLGHLAQCDLTINFYAYKFFNSKPKGTGYVSQFEGGNAWGDGSYITTRDEVEESMFDYSAAKPKPATVPDTVVTRVENLGKKSDPDFEPCIRPKYAALNYAKLKYGSAGQWGKSHIILKEYVKHNCTYVHSDSFDLSHDKALGGKVATFTNLSRLIANMPPAMLKALHQAANGATFDGTQVPGVGSTAYIEAHLHGEIRFDRDIERLVIDSGEVADSPVKTQTLKNQGKPFKVRSSKELTKTFTEFAKRNSIQLEII